MIRFASGGARSCCAVALVAALLGTGALAQSKGDNGFAVALAIGSGGLATAQPWAPGRRSPAAGLHALVAYRLSKLFDVGIHVSYQWLAVDGLEDGAGAFAWTGAAGFALRFHPLRLLDLARVDPWLGVGFDFFAYGRQATWTADQDPIALRTDAVPGASTPVGLGLDIAVTRDFAVGATATWGAWWHTEACTSVGLSASTCAARTLWPEHYFFVGLGCRMHLRFVE